MGFFLLIAILISTERAGSSGGRRNSSVLGRARRKFVGTVTRNYPLLREIKWSLCRCRTSLEVPVKSACASGKPQVKAHAAGPAIIAAGEGKMGIRLERSGGLILIKGAPDPPEPPLNKYATLGLWLALIILVGGILFIGPHSLTMADVTHTFKSFLTAVR
jgi:hypothetical protein